MWPEDWTEEMREEARRLQNEWDELCGLIPRSPEEMMQYEAYCEARGVPVTHFSRDFVERSLKRRRVGNHAYRFWLIK